MKPGRQAQGRIERPVFYVSDRPEAYEVGNEVSLDEAAMLARLIAENAGRRFPGIEFRIDAQWHSHDPSMNLVAAYIESHWERWAAGMARR